MARDCAAALQKGIRHARDIGHPINTQETAIRQIVKAAAQYDRIARSIVERGAKATQEEAEYETTKLLEAIGQMLGAAVVIAEELADPALELLADQAKVLTVNYVPPRDPPEAA